ncbi:unnamed protein product, partial [Mesorhabditis spiculigera]
MLLRIGCLLAILVTTVSPVSSVDYCASNPCYYGGTCTNGYGTFLCSCADGFFGTYCENPRDCYINPPNCHNGNCWASIWTDGTGAVLYVNTSCSCYSGWEGDACDKEIDACASNPCSPYASCLSYGYGYQCACPYGYEGTDCSLYVGDSQTDYCTPDPCVAGICVNATASSYYFCKCVAGAYPAMSNQYCSQPDTGLWCDRSTCMYGSCSIGTSYNSTSKEVLSVMSTCYCLSGFIGDYCDKEYDICAMEAPCQNGGSCDSVWGSWLCTCAPGFTGSNCTALDTETTTLATTTTEMITTEATTNATTTVGLPCVCAEVTYGGKVYHGEVCKVMDSGGACVDNSDGSGFTCQCTSNFTGQYCDMAANLGVMLGQLYGDLTPEEMQTVREDLQSHPPKLQDLIPFITGPMAEDVRAALSWNYDDIFMDAAYERRSIVFENQFKEWNDVVLGNCFTFNHPNSSTQFLSRNSGRNGGLFLQLRVHEEEYPYWVDTAAITVFVHKNGEAVFAESSRTQAKAGGFTKFFVRQTDYHRLGGRYGACAKTVADVKSYYYEGIYTIDGCYRSCYQDLLYAMCKCMDPRYPFPSSKPSCDIPQRSCLNQFTIKYGDDPASLPGCNCPQPCEYSQFEIAWSLAPFPVVIQECTMSANVTACEDAYRDSVKIEVNFQSLTQLIYREEPEMSFNAFLGYLGGILGVLCGISIVTFIEFGYVFLLIVSIMTRGKK